MLTRARLTPSCYGLMSYSETALVWEARAEWRVGCSHCLQPHSTSTLLPLDFSRRTPPGPL